MTLLTLEGTERLVAQLVIRRARELQNEEQKIYFQNLRAAVQTGVVRAFG